MKLMQLNAHYSAEEAYRLLMLLDSLRDTLWLNYHEEIREYCQQQQMQEAEHTPFIADNDIPF